MTTRRTAHDRKRIGGGQRTHGRGSGGTSGRSSTYSIYQADDFNIPRGAGADALHDYVGSNPELVRTDPTLTSVIHLLSSKLFSHGLAFSSNGKSIFPDAAFQYIVDKYWDAFLYKSLPFIIAHGYLVWFIYRTKEGVTVPAIPDFGQITVRMQYDDVVGITETEAVWRDEAPGRPELFVFNSALPFAITKESRMAPVDKIKPLLRLIYMQDEAHTVASHMNARPPMIVQHTVAKEPNTPAELGATAVVNPFVQYECDKMRQDEVDDLYIGRLRRLADDEQMQGYEDADAGDQGPRQWWVHSQDRMKAPLGRQFVVVPQGGEFIKAVEGKPDTAYRDNRVMWQHNIYEAFGIPTSFLGGGDRGGEKVSKGAQIHETNFISTSMMWWRVYGLFMTEVYRKIYAEAELDEAVEKLADKTEDKEDRADPTHVLFRKQTTGPVRTETVRVYLQSQFVTSPEQATSLYVDRVVDFQTYQHMRAAAVGLDRMVINPSLKPPTELVDQATLEAASAASGIAGKKRPSSSSGGSEKPAKKKTKKSK